MYPFGFWIAAPCRGSLRFDHPSAGIRDKTGPAGNAVANGDGFTDYRFSVHACLVSSRVSHALANLQSRMTVCGEI
jgi:hypothetical protein